jgi:hypothetical protein
MRTFGRVQNPYPLNGEQSSASLTYGSYKWVEVTTDELGYDDYVYVTTLIQCLRLNLGESPFFAQFGIPAHNSVLQQTHPDFYVTFIQNYFSGFFASLLISKRKNEPLDPTPVYDVSIIRMNGSKLQLQVAL